MIEIEALYREYFHPVYVYLLQLTKNQTLAEDLTAETFLQAMKYLDQYRGEADIRVWLCQIGKNAYYSQLRRRKPLVDLDTLPDLPGTEDPVEEILNAELQEAMAIALAALEEPYHEVFLLRHYMELPFRDIGNHFGKSENWACVTYHRARKKIRKELEESQ